MNSELTNLSPLDGRYSNQLNDLKPYLSEFDLIKNRVKVEIAWLISLGENNKIPEVKKFDKKTVEKLNDLVSKFSEKDAQRVKSIEKITNHDVKAIEYWLKEHLKANNSVKKYLEFIHFACTSEDINNLAYSLMVKNSVKEVLIPKIKSIYSTLKNLANRYKKISMLSRTHGQSASPTTLGKELANVAARIKRQIDLLDKQSYLGKINGAVGNFNAHLVAYPNVNWEDHAKKFVSKLGLKYNDLTTQIEPHDFLAEIFHSLLRINNILIDFNRDIWSYISIGYFKQKLKNNEVGSSTMPHKVNPIDFENSEGNLGLSNSLLDHLAIKLPISRMQRDLTDSTVLRNIGVAFGYQMLALNSLNKGLGKLEVNKTKIKADLDNSWEVLAEPIQTVMRKFNIPKPYEKLKALTRGNQNITKDVLKQFILNLDLPMSEKDRLLKLTPENYIGLAVDLVKKA